MIDEYNTIKDPVNGTFKDKGSKFIATAYPVNCVNEVLEFMDINKKEYHDARHHCYAYDIGLNNDNWRVNDDGEPSGTAGKPILGQIQSFGLKNVLIIVVRYFGGTLLGVGGLRNAYKNASREALNNARIISRTVNSSCLINFPYGRMNDIMKLIKEENIDQSDQVFEVDCSIRIHFRLSLKERILDRLSKIEDITFSCGQ